MKIKNLKFVKGASILAGGAICTLVIGGWLNSTSPDISNGIEEHKVIVQTYKEEQIEESSFYESSWDMEKAIVVKTPYKENIDGKIVQRTFYVNPKNYSNVEINFIKDNYNNQDLLLEQDYIIDLINYLKNNSREGINITKEMADQIPEDNNYEVSYATFIEDFEDIIIRKPNDIEKILSYASTALSYGLTFLAYFALVYAIKDCIKFENEQEDKSEHANFDEKRYVEFLKEQSEQLKNYDEKKKQKLLEKEKKLKF